MLNITCTSSLAQVHIYWAYNTEIALSMVYKIIPVIILL